MRKKLFISISLLSVFFSSSVFAKPDYRLQTIIYHQDQVVRLNGVAGVSTHISLGPNYCYATHYLGNSQAWKLAAPHETTCKHDIFIKPSTHGDDTNLTIIAYKKDTDEERSYNFLLHYVPGIIKTDPDGKTHVEFAKDPTALAETTLEINFVYPNDEWRLKHEQEKKREEEFRRKQLQEALKKPDIKPKNFDYALRYDRSSASILPMNIWDDYKFTYFLFPKSAELPTIFIINSNGKEATVNSYVEGPDHNLVVAQATSPEWRIRYGKRVIAIKNKAFNPNIGDSSSGTVSSHVLRVVGGNNQNKN